MRTCKDLVKTLEKLAAVDFNKNYSAIYEVCGECVDTFNAVLKDSGSPKYANSIAYQNLVSGINDLIDTGIVAYRIGDDDIKYPNGEKTCVLKDRLIDLYSDVFRKSKSFTEILEYIDLSQKRLMALARHYTTTKTFDWLRVAPELRVGGDGDYDTIVDVLAHAWEICLIHSYHHTEEPLLVENLDSLSDINYFREVADKFGVEITNTTTLTELLSAVVKNRRENFYETEALKLDNFMKKRGN